MTVPTTGARYHFPCQRWLARDRGDRKLVVEFTPSSVQEFGMFVSFLVYSILFPSVNLFIYYLFFLIIKFFFFIFLIFCLFVCSLNNACHLFLAP